MATNAANREVKEKSWPRQRELEVTVTQNKRIKISKRSKGHDRKGYQVATSVLLKGNLKSDYRCDNRCVFCVKV